MQHLDNVLGTSLDIVAYGGSADGYQQALDATLAEIARLEQILSTWRDDSEIMILNRERESGAASDALIDVVQACEAWLAASNGAFSCRMGQVIALWNSAVSRQERPIVPDMLPTARAAQQNPLDLDIINHRVALGDSISLEPSGLAKGYIIDRAVSVLQTALPDATAIKLDIGGDAFYWGSPPGDTGWQVDVADSQTVSDNGPFITTLSLNGMAVATSGHQTRTWNIRGESFSQILDTRRGWPIDRGLYTVVIAPDALTADAVATTLATQNADQAMAFVNQLDGVEAMAIDHDGRQFLSANWQSFLGGNLKRQANSVIELTLDYTIPNLRGRDYKRPYLAIWISNSEGRPIRNLLLLGSESRWAENNAVWWSRVGRRQVVPGSNVTRPTREPGRYTLTWDGRDNDGNILLQGDYQLMLEAAREHGGHDYMRIPFSLTEGIQTIAQEGSGELGDVRLTVSLTLPNEEDISE